MKHATWLMKSEPEVYSIDDLARDKRTLWEGVRNYQARNFLRDQMREGDLAFFYHSNANPPGVAGLMRVVSGPRPDPTALDRESPYFDAKSTAERPVWYCREMAFVRKFPRLVTLAALKADPALTELGVVRKGQRLSVMPVRAEHAARILEWAGDRGFP